VSIFLKANVFSRTNLLLVGFIGIGIIALWTSSCQSSLRQANAMAGAVHNGATYEDVLGALTKCAKEEEERFGTSVVVSENAQKTAVSVEASCGVLFKRTSKVVFLFDRSRRLNLVLINGPNSDL
jgi:hypothetical protein